MNRLMWINKGTMNGYPINEARVKTVNTYYQEKLIKHIHFVIHCGLKIAQRDDILTTPTKIKFLANLGYHDLSKFSRAEIDYAFINWKKYKAGDTAEVFKFRNAWHHHKMHNPHHPEYWWNVKKNGLAEILPMPEEYILEMIADWEGAGMTYGNAIHDWLPDNIGEFRFHPYTCQLLITYLKEFYDINIRNKRNSETLLEVY